MRKLTELPNGLRIVTEPLKDRDSVSLGVWLAAGGRYEQDANKGVAHFLEHMAFKGSRQYSCDSIKQIIEGVGGSLNAFTGEEETCYHAKVSSSHLKNTFDVLSDISFFPTLKPKDVAKERGVILEEIKMYHDLPQYYVGELLEGLLWPDHPLGKSLAGTVETVGGMSAGQLKGFHGRFYAPQNAVIAACGRIDHDELVGLARRKLSGLKASSRITPIGARQDQTKPAANLYHKETEQMHLMLGYLSFDHNHPDHYALALLSIVLGGNMSSRLFNEVRERRGLAYSVGTGTKSLDDTGAFMVRAGIDNSKIVPALDLILKVLSKVALQGVTQDEFQRAKDYYTGQFQLGLEDTMDYMLWIGSVVISDDKVKTVKDVMNRIKAVRIEDLQRVAAHVLAANRVNVSIIGPLTKEQEKDINRIIGL